MKIPNLQKAFLKLVVKVFYRQRQLKAAALIFIVIGSAIVFGGLIFMGAFYSAGKKAIMDKHEAIASSASEEIRHILRRHEDLLGSAASIIGSLDNDPWQQETILVELVLRNPAFLRVSSFDLKCRLTATSDLGEAPRCPDEDKVLGGITAGNSYVSEARFYNNGIPYVSMALPIKRSGEVRAFLLADIDIKEVWSAMDNVHVGRSGYIAVVSKDGSLITHKDKKLVFKKANIITDKDASSVLQGEAASKEWFDDKAKTRWLSSYVPIGSTPWGLMLRQASDEAFFSLRLLRIQMSVIIILGLIIAAGLSFYLGNLFVKPLQLLILQARGMGLAPRPEKGNSEDELRQLTSIFDRLSSRLKEAEATQRFSGIGEATAWVAHELKNSLFSIKSFVRLFPQRQNDEQFVRKFNTLVPEEIERLERILRDLTYFSASGEIVRVPVDIREVITQVVGLTEETLRQRHVCLQCKLQSAELILEADAELLKQVFLNLIINAVHAMPQGGEITISAEPINAAYLQLRVSDTGCGIPQERLKDIFEPFRSTKKDGFGLGLLICRKIIQQHGGSVEVASRPNQGTTFTITLPVKNVPEFNKRFDPVTDKDSVHG